VVTHNLNDIASALTTYFGVPSWRAWQIAWSL
jgi:hypothetical protein